VSLRRDVDRRTESKQRFIPTDDPVLSGGLHLPFHHRMRSPDRIWRRNHSFWRLKDDTDQKEEGS
jgi:hypothetical protein